MHRSGKQTDENEFVHFELEKKKIEKNRVQTLKMFS